MTIGPGARRRFALTALAATVACGGLPPASHEELMRRDADFAATVAARDAAAFGSFIGDDAVFLALDGSVARGREAVLAEWRSILDAPAMRLSWQPLASALSGDGSLGYTYGEWRMTREGGTGSELLRTGRYATVWRRDDDGAWRVVLDIGNADATPKAEMSF